MAKDYTNFIFTQHIPVVISHNKIKNATLNYKALTQLNERLENGKFP